METTKLNKWIHSLELKGKRESTVKTYNKNVKDFYMYCYLELGLSTEEEIIKNSNNDMLEGYRIYLEAELKRKPSTINLKLISIKIFFKFLVEKDNSPIIKEFPFDKVELIDSIKVEEETTEKEIISIDEAKEILKASYNQEKGERNFKFSSARNRFLFSLLISNGCRIEEVLSAKLEDLKPIDDGYIVDIGMKKVKNHLNKKAFIVGDVLTYYNDYMKERNKDEKYNSEYLIISNTGKKMDRRNTNDILGKLIKKANIDIHFTNHCCRHFCATVLVDKGNSSELIKKLLGWKQRGDKMLEKYTNHSINGDKTLIKMVKSVLE